MSDLWMPGVERRPQGQAVRLDAGLPARAIWHITADNLGPDGSQPPFDNVSTYLERVAYCPHLMWDPFTGRVVQYYPADVGARALTRWNEDGRHVIQIETYFAYGTNREGKRWNTVAETPCVGLDRILGWLDSLGIPRVWPAGSPKLSGNRQDVAIWNSSGGHYGHSQVPGETHTDPGPMPPFPVAAVPLGQAVQEEDLIPGLSGLPRK